MRDCEAVTPVMIRRVPVPSPDHQDEPGQAVPGYSPPEVSSIRRGKEEASCLLCQHSKIRKHGEHGASRIRHRNHPRDETKLIEVWIDFS